MVERRVVRDPQQPRPERRIAAEVVQAMERAQERVLADVLGLVGADDPRRHPHDHRPVAVDELPERAQLPARAAPDELGVVDLLRRERGRIRAHDLPDDPEGPRVTSISTR